MAALDTACIVDVGDALVGGEGGGGELQELSARANGREVLPGSLQSLLHLPAMFEVNWETQTMDLLGHQAR